MVIMLAFVVCVATCWSGGVEAQLETFGGACCATEQLLMWKCVRAFFTSIDSGKTFAGQRNSQ